MEEGRWTGDGGKRLWPAVGLALALLLALVFAACGDDDEAPPAQSSETPLPAAFPVTLTDDGGGEVTFEQAPERIVALAPSFVAVLFELGAGDAIVAAGENTVDPPEAASIPKISGFDPSVETIVSYEPDLVMICCSDTSGLAQALEAAGVTSMRFDTPTTVEGVYAQIELIGAVVGKSAEAEAVVDGMRSDIEALVSQLGDVQNGPRTFIELDPQLFSVGPGSFMHEALTLLKAENITEATGEPYPQMSNEGVIAADPEVIVLSDGDFGESPESVAARPGWGAISAVENSRVHPVPGAFLSQAAPRLVDDLEELARLLYPERF
jgi:iron complex transport system substrate-binding protein